MKRLLSSLATIFLSGKHAAVRSIKWLQAKLQLDLSTKELISHNSSVWGKWQSTKQGGEILVDFNPTPETILGFSYLTNILAIKFNAKPIGFHPPTNHPDYIARRIYQSFNVNNFLQTKLSPNQRIKQAKYYDQGLKKIKSKQTLFDYHVDNIWIGIDIYETYLRSFSEPTINISDERLLDLFSQAIGQLIFWQDYLATHPVKSIIVSHDTYIYLGILCKIAYQHHIPVYYQNIHELVFLDKPFSIYAYFPYYHKIFTSLSKSEQNRGKKIAKTQIEKRFSGVLESDTPYMKISPFSKAIQDRVVKNTPKTKVLICAHSFFDNPYAYGPMLFIDFYEWLEYLAKVSQKTNYEWYLKLHPGALADTVRIVKEYIKRYPNIVLVPERTSHPQLRSEGIDYVLTVYGSVGHEYPLLGAQVINAGYNPHVAYDFNWNPQSIEEYERIILNLPKYKKAANPNDVYEFYYMHFYFSKKDNLILNSYRESLSKLSLEDRTNSKTYAYFLNQFTKPHHAKTIKTINDFIDSGKQYLIASGPFDIRDSMSKKK